MSARAVVILAVVAALVVIAPLIMVTLSSRRRLSRLRAAQLSESELLRSHLDQQDATTTLTDQDYAYLRDAVVMVIGAGGSIAGELVRELAAAGCRQLVLVDNNENGLYSLVRQLGVDAPDLVPRVRVELANARDHARITGLFETYEPQVVFHYANYKSAALGNRSAYGFVLVNVGGTRNVLSAVDRTASVRHVVYISSDKAQAASQTYGRTKRVAELMVRAHAQANHRVRFVSLRYCNVLDAAGSFAIPTFRAQIAAGTPVTVRTMPGDVVPDRYFITRTVAARLAIRAGAVAGRGNILSLDADRVSALPIDELVVILARAYGIRDVERWFRRNVRFVAAEDGEKPSEALGTGTPVERAPLIQIPAPAVDGPGLDVAIGELLALTRRQDVEQVPERLRQIVDAFGAPVRPVPPGQPDGRAHLERVPIASEAGRGTSGP